MQVPNKKTQLRALDAISRGTELTYSYLLLGDAESRADRLQEEYGFTCQCGRCKLDLMFFQQDEEEGNETGVGERDVEGKEEKEEDWKHEEDVEGEEDITASPVYNMLFMLKHCCDQCTGTMCPMEGYLAVGCYECNRCGARRSTQELQELIDRQMEMDEEDEGDEGEGEEDEGEK